MEVASKLIEALPVPGVWGTGKIAFISGQILGGTGIGEQVIQAFSDV